MSHMALFAGSSWMLYFGLTHLLGKPVVEVGVDENRYIHRLGGLSYVDISLPLSTVREYSEGGEIHTSLYHLVL